MGGRWDSVLDSDNVARVIAKLTDRYSHAREEWPEPGRQSAAVLVPIVAADGVPSVLFTLRSRELSHHRNQVSFPGGLAETTDATPMVTALRETEEELGIHRSRVEVWGKMNAYPGQNTSTSITPVVGYIRDVDISQLRINKSEVVQVFTLPLAHIACKKNQHFTEFRVRSSVRSYRLPVFVGGPRRIWGFTALALDMLITHLAPKGEGYIPIMARTFNNLKA